MIFQRPSKNGGTIEYFTVDDCPHPFQYWKDAQCEGWYSTDDGYVVWVRKVKYIEEVQGKSMRVRRRISFILGNMYAHGRSRYELMPRLQKGVLANWGMNVPMWYDQRLRSEPALLTTFTGLVLQKIFTLDKYRYNAYQYAVLRAVSKKFYGVETEWRAVRTLFNHDKVRAMIQEEIDKVLKNREINVEKVFDLLKSAEEMGLTHVDKMGNVGIPSAVIAVAEKYAGLLGMSGKKQLSDGQHQRPDQLPGAENTYDKIIATEEAVIVEEEKKDE